jgi:hypothetical protein
VEPKQLQRNCTVEAIFETRSPHYSKARQSNFLTSVIGVAAAIVLRFAWMPILMLFVLVGVTSPSKSPASTA